LFLATRYCHMLVSISLLVVFCWHWFCCIVKVSLLTYLLAYRHFLVSELTYYVSTGSINHVHHWLILTNRLWIPFHFPNERCINSAIMMLNPTPMPICAVHRHYGVMLHWGGRLYITARHNYIVHIDTIRYTVFTCAQNWREDQLNLTHETKNEKIRKTKNKNR